MQEISPGLILGVLGVLIVLGVVIVVVWTAYSRRSRSDEQRETQPPIQQQPRPQQPQSVASSQTAEAPVQRAEAPVQRTEAPVQRAEAPVQRAEAPAHPGEVMRVIRDERTGRVLVEVDGKRYAHIREITDAQVGRSVLWAIADLVGFTGGMATNPQAIRSIVQAQPAPPQKPVQQPRPTAPAPVPASDPMVSSGSVLDRLEAASAPEPEPPALGPAPTPRARPSYELSVLPPEEKPRRGYSLVNYFRQGFEKSAPTAPMPSPTSFIDEIEEILQAHIRRLPSPLPVEVHVRTASDGSLQIEIGVDAYSSAEEVPDPQIRQLIQGAVSEWEKS
jgi:hypothetical protein